MAKFNYAVTGDFSRVIYSRHHTLEAAQRACRALAAKWGALHLGSEPRVIDLHSRRRPHDTPSAV